MTAPKRANPRPKPARVKAAPSAGSAFGAAFEAAGHPAEYSSTDATFAVADGPHRRIGESVKTEPERLRVLLHPPVSGPDDGQGGVRRVVEGMRAHLPAHGVELVDRPEDADVIACHISIPPAWVKQYPNKAFVAHCHGLYWAEMEWPQWALSANADVLESIRVADAVTVPTEWVARIVRTHTARRPVVIPHGLELDQWSPGNGPGYVWWDKTRPDPVCDPKPMQDVAALLPDVSFLSTFGQVAPNVGIVGHLTFEQAKKLTQDAAIYLATSRETFGVSIIQALASGVPVVGFRWGGAAEIVTHKVDGYLARPNDIEDLAAGIRWALANREKLSVAALSTAQGFGWEEPAAQYYELYRRVYDARQSQAQRPRTSIIVPAYRLAATLPATLESVAAQFDQDWECIVVDDASPDRCGEIADEFAKRDPRFRVLRNETNLYLSGARNAGIRASRGRYILPLDADDMLPPMAVRLLADALDADRTAHVVYGNVSFVKEDGVTLEDYGDRGGGHSGWPMQFDWDWQRQGRNLLPYSSMYRREAWELTGGYRRRCRTAEDADFWLRVSSFGFRPKMVTQADTLIYRNRPGSMSRVQPAVDWAGWFGWKDEPRRAPAGAVTALVLPIASYDPPALSVIIPVGPGHEDLVMDAIDSCEAQTFGWFEVIVVNDSGKPLHLPSWVRRVDADGRNSRFGGVAAARNAGIEVARARYFLPLDADDILEPGALAEWFTLAKQHPGEVLYSDFYEDPDQVGEFKPYETPDWDPALLTRRGAIHAVTALTPVEVWRKAGGYDEEVPWEDWVFQLRCAELGVCSRRIPRPLFTYRKHTGRRREFIQGENEAAKRAVQAKYGRMWEGRVLEMACGSCGAGRVNAGPPAAVVPLGEAGPGLQLLQYDGDMQAKVEYRAPSGRTYGWSKGDINYVASEDVSYFMGRPGFTLTQPPAAADSAPSLVSANPG